VIENGSLLDSDPVGGDGAVATVVRSGRGHVGGDSAVATTVSGGSGRGRE
jgi:hypothetical protein